MAKAEPALLAAQEALDTLNKVTRKPKGCRRLAKQSGDSPHTGLIDSVLTQPASPQNNLTKLKSFGSPPDAVINVTAAITTLTAPGGKIPKDKSWKAAKIMMGKVDTFLDSLKKFDKEHIPEACLKAFK